MHLSPDQFRKLALAAPEYLALIHKRERLTLDKLYAGYKNAESAESLMRLLAEYAVIRDQIHELTTTLKLNQGD
jgi:hypothetical protein